MFRIFLNSMKKKKKKINKALLKARYARKEAVKTWRILFLWITVDGAYTSPQAIEVWSFKPDRKKSAPTGIEEYFSNFLFKALI